jgi:hypothetical protein
MALKPGGGFRVERFSPAFAGGAEEVGNRQVVHGPRRSNYQVGIRPKAGDQCFAFYQAIQVHAADRALARLLRPSPFPSMRRMFPLMRASPFRLMRG